MLAREICLKCSEQKPLRNCTCLLTVNSARVSHINIAIIIIPEKRRIMSTTCRSFETLRVFSKHYKDFIGVHCSQKWVTRYFFWKRVLNTLLCPYRRLNRRREIRTTRFLSDEKHVLYLDGGSGWTSIALFYRSYGIPYAKSTRLEWTRKVIQIVVEWKKNKKVARRRPEGGARAP